MTVEVRRWLPSQVGGILKLSAGTAIAHAFPLAITPILARLYSPAEFGALAVYASAVAVLGAIACWRYELAIPLPKDAGDGASLLALSILLSGLSALVLLLAIALLYPYIRHALHDSSLSAWIWLLPVHIGLYGAYHAIGYWLTRNQRFGAVSMGRIGQSGATGITQLIGGWVVKLGSGGLIVGALLGQTFGACVLGRGLADNEARQFFRVSKADLRRVGGQYRPLAVYALPTAMLNALSANALPLLIAYSFGPFAAGIALLGQRLIIVPLNLLVSSIWQVVHASLGPKNDSERRDVLRNVHNRITVLLAFPMACIAGCSKLAGPIFGSEWEPLESILPFLAGMAYVNGVSNATSYFAAFGRYRAEVLTNVLLFGVRVCVVIIGAKFFGAFDAIKLYAVVSAFVYIGISFYWAKSLNLLSPFIFGLLRPAAVAAVLVGVVSLLELRSVWILTAAMLMCAGIYCVVFWPVLRPRVN